ncbi:hypothetical protein [Herbidospora sp. NBRC 101105]|uniref:hypothetical protein n=1 Tax=Herbidospora sp. NBRC 101105 TaxID=3032195 RepID=UPI002555405D|nr:hypothetical protein [Herbidospora sp. NBRC 101105]
MKVRVLAAAAILLAGGAFGAWPAAAAGSHRDPDAVSVLRAEVSDIREILNQTKTALSVVSGESKATVAVPANGRWSGSMWVPWVGNDGEMGKSIVVYQGQKVLYWIFQDYWNTSHQIRFSTSNSYQQSKPVPGAATGAGRKRLIIRADGTPLLESVPSSTGARRGRSPR